MQGMHFPEVIQFAGKQAVLLSYFSEKLIRQQQEGIDQITQHKARCRSFCRSGRGTFFKQNNKGNAHHRSREQHREIGRASCREREEDTVVEGASKNKMREAT